MPLRLVENRVVFTGRKLRLEIHTVEDAKGVRHSKEVVVHPGSVVVLPLLDDATVLLIRNQRHAVGHALLELPAGTLEAGEAPAACAARELEEETGYRPGRLRPMGSFFTSPGILTERMHAFVADVLEQTARALAPGEEIDLAPCALDEALAMVRDGRILDAKTIAVLLLFDRFLRAPGGIRPA